MKPVLEIYLRDKLITRLASSILPNVGDFINIKGVTYKVVFRSYAIDYLDIPQDTQIRCNIDILEEHGKDS